jgi:hypothetical protein
MMISHLILMYKAYLQNEPYQTILYIILRTCDLWNRVVW